MAQHQGTMEWGPCVGPTQLCLGVVSLLCSVSVLIVSFSMFSYSSSLAGHTHTNEKKKQRMREELEREFLIPLFLAEPKQR